MPSSECSVDDARIEDWFKHDVPNQFLITDPTIRQPGFDLNRSDWTFSTGIALAMAVVQLLCMTGVYETIRSVRVAVNNVTYRQRMPVNDVSRWAPGAHRSHCMLSKILLHTMVAFFFDA